MRLNKNGDIHLTDLRKAVANAGYEIRHCHGRTISTSGPGIFRDGQKIGAHLFGVGVDERFALERALSLAQKDKE